MRKKVIRTKRAAKLMARYIYRNTMIYAIMTWLFMLIYIVFNELDKYDMRPLQP